LARIATATQNPQKACQKRKLPQQGCGVTAAPLQGYRQKFKLELSRLVWHLFGF
jgi:hypothetical protein